MSETNIIYNNIVDSYDVDRPCIWYLKGLPASGKSSWAQTQISNSQIRLNKDDFRLMMGGKFSDDKEKAVIAGLRAAGINALASGLNIIVDDTNFSDKHKNFWKALAEQHKYSLVEIYFETPVDVCIARDATRGAKSVGATVIRDMYKKYIKKENESRVIAYRYQDESLPKAIIVDIDGTIALMTGRSPYDNSKVDTDAPHKPIVELVTTLEKNYVVLLVSGREGTSDCYTKTRDWLNFNHINYDELFMRAEGDTRKDSIVKREIFEKHIEGKYNILCVLDDRDQTVEMWRKELNLPCLQVNYGNF